MFLEDTRDGSYEITSNSWLISPSNCIYRAAHVLFPQVLVYFVSFLSVQLMKNFGWVTGLIQQYLITPFSYDLNRILFSTFVRHHFTYYYCEGALPVYLYENIMSDRESKRMYEGLPCCLCVSLISCVWGITKNKFFIIWTRVLLLHQLFYLLFFCPFYFSKEE